VKVIGRVTIGSIRASRIAPSIRRYSSSAARSISPARGSMRAHSIDMRYAPSPSDC
jgi:hypothetical protein